MTKRQLHIVLAVLLVFSILATVSAVRTDIYIRETQRRDQAQEACNTATIEVLKIWVQLRVQRDGSMDARDDAALAADETAGEILERLISGQEPTQEELHAWLDDVNARRDAVANDHRVRTQANEARVPLPNC